MSANETALPQPNDQATIAREKPENLLPSGPLVDLADSAESYGTAIRYGAQAGVGFGWETVLFGPIDFLRSEHDAQQGDQGRLVSTSGVMNLATVVDAVMDSENSISSTVTESRERLQDAASQSYRIAERSDPTESKSVTAVAAGAGYALTLATPSMLEISAPVAVQLVEETTAVPLIAGLQRTSFTGDAAAIPAVASRPATASSAVPVMPSIGPMVSNSETDWQTHNESRKGPAVTETQAVEDGSGTRTTTTFANGSKTVHDQFGRTLEYRQNGLQASETFANGDRLEFPPNRRMVRLVRANGEEVAFGGYQRLEDGGMRYTRMPATPEDWTFRADGTLAEIRNPERVATYDTQGRILREVTSEQTVEYWPNGQVRRTENPFGEVTYRDEAGSLVEIQRGGRVIWSRQ